MIKVIITGSDGFVGKHLTALLKKGNHKIYPLDKAQADITNYQAVEKYLLKIKPDQVYHLAGFASGAGEDRDLIFKVNVQGTINIIKALKSLDRPVKILLASTAYVYGNTFKCADENGKIEAKSFYDQSKIKMEQEARKFISSKTEIVITRASNHIGPGQKLGFVVPDFCSQIAKEKSSEEILVGNLAAKRDIFDVRDCVKAYKLVMQKGKSGQIYNIGTGKTISIKDILEKLINISGKKIAYRIDSKRMRPSDISKNCVNISKIRHLGWQPKIGLEKTLRDTYRHWSNLKFKDQKLKWQFKIQILHFRLSSWFLQFAFYIDNTLTNSAV